MTCLAFLIIGGLLAGINHTRYDIVFGFFGHQIYDSKAHDVHHRFPQTNYGQYIMLWDIILGSYRYVVEFQMSNPLIIHKMRQKRKFLYILLCLHILSYTISYSFFVIALLSNYYTELTIPMIVSIRNPNSIRKRVNRMPMPKQPLHLLLITAAVVIEMVMQRNINNECSPVEVISK